MPPSMHVLKSALLHMSKCRPFSFVPSCSSANACVGVILVVKKYAGLYFFYYYFCNFALI